MKSKAGSSRTGLRSAPRRTEMSLRSRRGFLGFLVGGALALLAGRGIAAWYADWALYSAVGFGELWQLKASTLALLKGGTMVIATAFAFVHLLAVRHSIVSLVMPTQLGGLEIAEEVPTRRLTLIAAAIALAVGIFFTVLPQEWTIAASAWDAVSFTEIDPYLKRDLGFYLTWLPWERSLQARAMSLTLVVAALVMALYAATPSVRWSAQGLYLSVWARRHLAVFGGIVVVLIGWGWNLDRFERLSPGTGVWLDATTDGVFGAFDHRIALPYRAFAAFATIPMAVVLVIVGWRSHLRSVVSLLTALIVIGPVATAVLPAIAKRPLPAAESRAMERPYRSTSALFTRRAFSVDEILRDVAQPSAVPATRLSRSVSAWDPAALQSITSASAQRDTSVAFAWATRAEGLEGIAIERPRIAKADMETWGAVPYVAASADEAGRPFHSPSVGDGRLAGVLVHPGAQRAVFTADVRGDLAAPPFETTTQRIALSWAQQDPRLLVRDVPGPRPRLMSHRDVRDRIHALVPFLEAGPTLVPYVRGDSLYWFLELFVTADRYPLSEDVAMNGRAVRYAKHAATAVVQAQTGQVIIIPTESPDPIMRGWMARAGTTFTPLAAAPEWIRAERPPAVDWMVVQGSALAHVGFQGDTLGPRRLTRPDDADADLAEGPPSFFQLDTLGTLGWALPVDIPWAGRTLGILVARGGSERRTEFVADAGPRWTTVLETLQSAADQAGFGRSLPNARRGRVQAIPTSDGATWVQSYYDWPRDGSPRLAGVVVSRNDSTVAAHTLAEALGERSPATRLDGDAFRERVARIYDAMQAALRAGDWRAYGDAWAALGRLLQRP